MVTARLKPYVDFNAVRALATGPAPAAARADYEEALRARLGATRVFALSSGRAALLLGLKGLGVKPGSEVAIPALTCTAVPDAVLALGGVPALVDVSPRHFGMEARSLKRLLSRGRTRAAVLAPLFGACPPEGEVHGQLAAYGVPWLEDAAQSFGASFGGRPAGGRGPLAVLSTNFDKSLTTGRGGALVVNDPAYLPEAEKLVTELPTQTDGAALTILQGLIISLRLFAGGRYGPFTSMELGYRYAAAEGDAYDLASLLDGGADLAAHHARAAAARLMAEPRPPRLARAWKWFFPRAAVPRLDEAARLAPSLAAVGTAHLAKLDEEGRRRRELTRAWDEAFTEDAPVRGPAWGDEGDTPWPIRYPAYVRDYRLRPRLIEGLAAAGYETGPFVYPRPISGQFPYYKLSRTAARSLRGAWRAAYGLLNLPLHDEITLTDVARMTDILRRG